MKTVSSRAAAAGIAVLAVLLLVVGLRVDTSLLVFVLGVVCGAVSSAPLAVIVTALVLQSRERGRRRERDYRYAQPPVVVVQSPPGSAQYQPASTNWPGPHALAPARREFTVIGDDVLEPGEGA